MSPAEKIERARALLSDALALAREVMVAAYDSGRMLAGSDAEEAADLIHEASMQLEAAKRGWALHELRAARVVRRRSAARRGLKTPTALRYAAGQGPHDAPCAPFPGPRWEFDPLRNKPPLTPAQRVALERRLTARLGWDRPLPMKDPRREPSAAIKALLEQGTVERIRQILAQGDRQAEMRILHAIYGRVSDLLESIVLEPEFSPLFTDRELGRARWRLAKFIRGLNSPPRTRRPPEHRG